MTPDPPADKPVPPKRPAPPPLDLSEAIKYFMPGAYIGNLLTASPKSPEERLVSKWSDDTDSAKSIEKSTSPASGRRDPALIGIFDNLRGLQALLKEKVQANP